MSAVRTPLTYYGGKQKMARVSMVLPVYGGISETVTLWQIAEALDTVDLDDVCLTLNGLERFGYVWSAPSESRSRRVYWRTPKGDEAVLDEEGC
jgi:hypothetical protein